MKIDRLFHAVLLVELTWVVASGVYAQTTPLPLASSSSPITVGTASSDGRNPPNTDVGTVRASTATGSFPAIAPKGRPIIGLVLEGGGALGLAHIGVLQWFEENHIPVDRLAGTSMGALIGGLYASGHSTKDLQQIATKGVFPKIFTLEAAYSDVGYRRRQDRRDLPQAVTLGLKDGVSFRNAVLTDLGLNEFLREEFSAYNAEGITFDQLPIPFRCVATDLNSLGPVVFSGGPMPQAVRASISIPGIFPPVSYHGHYLVDGAIMDNLPTDIARNDLHSDVVIAVHLSTSAFEQSDVNSIIGIFSRAYSAGTARTERAGKALADILLEAPTNGFSTSDYEKGAQLIQAGYTAAERHRAELMRYQLDDEEWEAYLAARNSRRRLPPGMLRQVEVEGGSRSAQLAAMHDLATDKGKRIDASEVAKGTSSRARKRQLHRIV